VCLIALPRCGGEEVENKLRQIAAACQEGETRLASGRPGPVDCVTRLQGGEGGDRGVVSFHLCDSA